MFGDIFGKSWREFKSNFWIFFVAILLLSFVPSVLLAISQSMYTSEVASGVDIFASFSFYAFIVLLLISILLGVLLSSSFISLALSKKKLTLGETLALGKKNFWRYFGFSIVIGLFLMGLFVLLIIPGIIFAVYWVFSSYIFIEKKKGIMESISESHDLVRGKWWNVFGNFVLLGLIFIAISIGAGLIQVILSTPFDASNLMVISIIASVTSFISGIFITPLMILFTKNFYYDLKKK